MEQFSRECLEIDTPANQSTHPDSIGGSSMDKVYDRAAKLVKRTLDVEGRHGHGRVALRSPRVDECGGQRLRHDALRPAGDGDDTPPVDYGGVPRAQYVLREVPGWKGLGGDHPAEL